MANLIENDASSNRQRLRSDFESIQETLGEALTILAKRNIETSGYSSFLSIENPQELDNHVSLLEIIIERYDNFFSYFGVTEKAKINKKNSLVFYC